MIYILCKGMSKIKYFICECVCGYVVYCADCPNDLSHRLIRTQIHITFTYIIIYNYLNITTSVNTVGILLRTKCPINRCLVVYIILLRKRFLYYTLWFVFCNIIGESIHKILARK